MKAIAIIATNTLFVHAAGWRIVAAHHRDQSVHPLFSSAF
jgi:hypothetical protein